MKSSGSDGLPDVLTKEWLIEVLSTVDSELRAHRIAWTYSRLAIELDDWLNGAAGVSESIRSTGRTPITCDANWFHFATWGTLTVTQNIGTTRVPQRLNTGLGLTVRRRLAPVALRARAADSQRMGRALAWGQRLIFAGAFCGMYWLKHQKGKDALAKTKDGALEEIIKYVDAQIKPEFEKDRVKPVQKAFRWYFLARQNAQEPVKKRQLIFGANVLLTAIEQNLVDPAISIVVNLAPHLVAEAFDWRVAQWANRVRGVPSELSMLYQSFRYLGPRTVIDTAWSRLMTDQVLVMALPAETLRLGRDVPPRERGKPFCVRELRDMTAPGPGRDQETNAALTEVVELIDSLDRTTVDGEGSAARDWRRWDERMNWAVALMRSRQADRTLFWSPYSIEDQERIYSGKLPLRTGDPSSLDVIPPLDEEIFRNTLSVPGYES